MWEGDPPSREATADKAGKWASGRMGEWANGRMGDKGTGRRGVILLRSAAADYGGQGGREKARSARKMSHVCGGQ